MSKKKHKQPEVISHSKNDLPGNLITLCDKCDGLEMQVKELKKKLQCVEDLANWYEVNIGKNIATHRIRQALNGENVNG